MADPKGVKVDEKQLTRYIDLERKIFELEGNDSLKKYEEITRQIEDVTQTIKQMEITVSQLEMKTKKEKSEFEELKKKDSIQAIVVNKEDLTREEEEYLAALNEEEVSKQNLEGLKKQRAEYESAAGKVKGAATELKQLYDERDSLLSDIFNGEYGSEEENRLEALFDELVDRKQRVSVAHYKWTNARMLLQHAVKQFGHANLKWNEVPQCTGNQQNMYATATECRNNLIAGQQNINSTQRYLSTITFPYCQPPEMETLNRAINNIYTDMSTPERHNHAFKCYDTTYRRASALLQWFDNVITGTIQKDLKAVTAETEQVETKLRAERLRLIKAKVEESGGKVGDISGKMNAGLIGNAEQKQLRQNDSDAFVRQPEHADDACAKMGQLTVDDRDPPPPTPLPLNALAPAPTEDEIFGSIDKLKSEQEQYLKRQDINKQRMQQSLESKREKLARARRHTKTS